MDATETHGFGLSPVLAEDGVQGDITEMGFNVLTLSYFGKTTTPHSYAASNFPQGGIVSGYSNMFITDVNFQMDGSGVYKFTVSTKGLLGVQGVKMVVDFKSQSYTTGPVVLPGIGAVPQAQGEYLAPSCDFTYVSFYPPITSTRPQDATPPPGMTLPSVPTNPFISLPTTPIYNYPAGWLRSINSEKIVGAEVYFIKEAWVYKYEYQPG